MAVDATEREVEVLAIFRQVLGVPQLGPEQNFFEAGGSSLLAARLAARLRSSGTLDVATSAIFAAPTARELTCYVATASLHQADDGEPAITSIPSPAAERGARQRTAFARMRRASSPVEEAR